MSSFQLTLFESIANFVLRLSPVKSCVVGEYITAVDCGLVNIYLYQRDGKTIVFDTGYSQRSTRQALSAVGVDPDSVSHVFLSHADFDHAGGIPVFSKACFLFSQAERRRPIRQSKHFRLVQTRFHCRMLRDMETVDIGDIQIKAIHTPGHTGGSMAYLVDGKFLFSGDTLSIKRGKARTNHLFLTSAKMLRCSADKLIKLAGSEKIELLLTAHWGVADFS